MATLADLARYSRWASKTLLDFARTISEEEVTRTIPNSHGGILKTFRHIYYADRVWLRRIEQQPNSAMEDASPGPSLKDLDAIWWPLLERIEAAAKTNDAATIVSFKRWNGDAHSLAFGDIVQHVVNHGTYHRGQIAAMLRQCGHVPPSTDYLFYVLPT